MLRIVSALPPDLALELERDLLRRADLHLIAVTTIAQLVAAARDGALLALVEPLLPDGNARDALDELNALEERVPLVLVATPDARRELGDQGFAAVIELPFTGGAFDDILGKLVDAPRRRGVRRAISARVYDEHGETIGRALDVASGGIALRTRRALTVGEELSLQLELPGAARLPAKGRVVRAVGENAALALESPSEPLREQLSALTSEPTDVEGISFRPIGALSAAVGGSFAEGPASSALLAHLAEGQGPRTLVLRDLQPLDDDALSRFIEVRGQLEELGPLTLRACPAWLGSLMSRMPAVRGAKAHVASLAVGVHCPGCNDRYDEEVDLPNDAAQARAQLQAERPCAVCGTMLELATPIEATLAFLYTDLTLS